jgi:hypothetical protein
MKRTAECTLLVLPVVTDQWALIHVSRHCGADVAWLTVVCEVVDDGAGVPGLPQGRARACSNEGNEVNLLVAAPLGNGHRSTAAGEERRQYSWANYTAVIRRAIERARRCLSISGSPWLRWTRRRGRWRSGSPELMAPAIGGNELDGEAMDRQGSIPSARWPCRGRRSQWW